MMRAWIIAGLALLGACGGDTSSARETYDRGYSDGYAVGYNTACEIRATLIAGDWENAEYSHGYSDGQTAGIIACNADRKAGTIK